jgi:flagellar biosynthesis protein
MNDIPDHLLNIVEGAPDAEAAKDVTKAVALEYDREHDDAPRVIASGKGAVAEQILNIAYAQGIKVRQDAELVEILSLIEIDSLIPLEAFAAVAEILTHVYEANASYQQRQHKGT